MISSVGFPSGRRGSAVNPAWISFSTLCSTNLLPTSFNSGYLIHGIVDLTVMGANGLGILTWITLTWIGTRPLVRLD